jgi:hypothetical protein
MFMFRLALLFLALGLGLGLFGFGLVPPLTFEVARIGSFLCLVAAVGLFVANYIWVGLRRPG